MTDQTLPTTWTEAQENLEAAYRDYLAVCDLNEENAGLYQEWVDAALDRWMDAQTRFETAPVAVELVVSVEAQYV